MFVICGIITCGFRQYTVYANELHMAQAHRVAYGRDNGLDLYKFCSNLRFTFFSNIES